MTEIKSISVLIPTYNEAENIKEVLERTINLLDASGCQYEILVIDDCSRDETAVIAESILGGKGRVIQRKGKPASLSLSIIDGIQEANGEYLIIMDADNSHPPEAISSFIEAARLGYDLIVGSRYVQGGGFDKFPLSRRIISGMGCLVGKSLTKIRDNTSGFFCIKKSALEKVKLSPSGFKIGLEIFVKARYRSYKEIPYIFAKRKKGKSKLSLKIFLQYFQQFLSLIFYKLRCPILQNSPK